MIPDTEEGLVEYFLDTEAQEIEFEIARLRPRSVSDFIYVMLHCAHLTYNNAFRLLRLAYHVICMVSPSLVISKFQHTLLVSSEFHS